MPSIIKDGQIVEDSWQLIRDPETELPGGPVIIPVELWQSQRDTLLERPDIGIWLSSEQSPKLIAEDLAQFSLVAVDFPKFADGRGFSYGRELREQHGYQGELRAIGDFMRDQLFYLKRCGFNSFALNLSPDGLREALASLNDFSVTYQASVDEPQPLFRRLRGAG